MELGIAIRRAATITQALEQHEDLDRLAGSRYGEERRAHDFARVDMPLLIDAANGRDPHQRENLSERQAELLKMAPADLAGHLKKNADAARRVFGWSMPHVTNEIREFIRNPDGFPSVLAKPFIAKQIRHHDTIEQPIEAEPAVGTPNQSTAEKITIERHPLSAEQKAGQPVSQRTQDEARKAYAQAALRSQSLSI